MLRERQVEHARLIKDEQITRQGVICLAQEKRLAISLTVLEEAVHRLGLLPGGLTEPLGGSAGRSSQADALLASQTKIEERAQQGGLPGTGAAGDHRNAVLEGGGNGLYLQRGQLDVMPGLKFGECRPVILRQEGRLAAAKVPQSMGHRPLGGIDRGKIHPVLIVDVHEDEALRDR